MKKLMFSLFSCISLAAAAQPTAGLIAHWDMDSSTNDVSTGGHNGLGNNLTPAAGMDGIMGHAWYFNGVNSSITVPYSPDFNVSGYTIASKIMVMGFYSGTCHGNTILARGKSTLPPGAYYLVMSDYPAGYGCSPDIDTTRESFVINAGGTSEILGPSTTAGYGAFDATPNIAQNTWYNVVGTFDGSSFKVYVNGSLVVTVPGSHPGMLMGSSTDSISIGYASYDAPFGYPYTFKGVMDDLMLYNRALTDSEIVHLYDTDTCGGITAQPLAATVPAGGTATYIVHFSVATPIYQWQQNAGSGFINLLDGGLYSGVTTGTLTVTGVTTAMNGNTYRCVINAETSCTDSSAAALLTVSPLSVHDLTEQQVISIYPNPVHNTVTISASANIESAMIFNVLGQKMDMVTPNEKSAKIDIAHFPTGIYYISVNGTNPAKLIKE